MGCKWNKDYNDAKEEVARLQAAYKPRMARLDAIKHRVHVAFLTDCSRLKNSHVCELEGRGLSCYNANHATCPAAKSAALVTRANRLRGGLANRIARAEEKRSDLYWYRPLAVQAADDTGDPLSAAGLKAADSLDELAREIYTEAD